jgi:hypothetical protein
MEMQENNLLIRKILLPPAIPAPTRPLSHSSGRELTRAYPEHVAEDDAGVGKTRRFQ